VNHSDFTIGRTFRRSDRQWLCTDIGARVIIPIRIDSVEVGNSAPNQRRILSRDEAEAEGWFNGPPYAVTEVVFDEDDMQGCAVERGAETANRHDEDER
jgi:hypothetical protein